MIEFIDTIKSWSLDNQPVAVARVTKTWGSSPRPIGSVMLIHENGNILGSVSGGCVEGAVAKNAKKCNHEKVSMRLSYGISDEDAWSVGLSCGGSLQVFVQPVNFKENKVWNKLLENLSNNISSTLITKLGDENVVEVLFDETDSFIGDKLPDEIVEQAKKCYNERISKILEHNEESYFVQIFPRKHLLLVVGAAHITVDLVTLANLNGFETVVIDPRGYFAKNTIFTSPPSKLLQSFPSEVLNKFPLDAYTFCAILSHDPKIDDDALNVLLPSEVGYIGALGSRKTHAKRVARLKEKGVSDDLINKIKAPIGMPIKAKSAREIALAVMGEIIQAKNEFL